MNKIKATEHSVLRFLERAMNEYSAPSKKKFGLARQLMLKTLYDEHPNVETLNNGFFPLVSLGIKLIIREGKIITVKEIDQSSRMKGGMIRGGTKAKKKFKQNHHQNDPKKYEKILKEIAEWKTSS